MENLEKNIENKVLAAIAVGTYKSSGEDYSENAILVWHNGNWETTCYNDHGNRYGSMKSGVVTLTATEASYIKEDPCKHIVMPYKAA